MKQWQGIGLLSALVCALLVNTAPLYADTVNGSNGEPELEPIQVASTQFAPSDTQLDAGAASNSSVPTLNASIRQTQSTAKTLRDPGKIVNVCRVRRNKSGFRHVALNVPGGDAWALVVNSSGITPLTKDTLHVKQ